MKWLARGLFLSEQIPIMLFVAVRYWGFDIQGRIFIGAAAALPFFALWAARRLRPGSLFLGTNVFFALVALVLLLPLQPLKDAFLALGEAGMFAVIWASAVVWFLSDPSGLLNTGGEPGSRKYPLLLLAVYSVCPVFSYQFRGNENVAGALPFVLLMFTEKILGFLQIREIKRNPHHG